jgi:hypothetical protein
MKLTDIITEANIDNQSGIGRTPNNADIDYFGAKVKMPPSVFLSLAEPLPRDKAESVEFLKQHMQNGGGVGAPTLYIAVPNEWRDQDFTTVGKVTNHEGRNRMYAIQELEGDTPVEVHLLFRSPNVSWRTTMITKEMLSALNTSLMPETSNIPVSGPLFA